MGGNCNVFLGWSTFSLTVTLIRNNFVWIYRVMELKATTLGKRLAQHPYDRAVILNAGIKVSGDRHEYLIPFNQLLRFTVSAVWYGASWNLYCRTKKWCVCTAPNGARRSVFTIISMLTGGGGVAR